MRSGPSAVHSGVRGTVWVPGSLQSPHGAGITHMTKLSLIPVTFLVDTHLPTLLLPQGLSALGMTENHQGPLKKKI